MFLHRSRLNYWALSKPIQAIRKYFRIESPGASTGEEWDEYHKYCKEKHPIIDWLTDEFVDVIQNFFTYPYDLYRSVMIALNQRFVDKSFCLDTKKSKWDYQEIDSRMFFGCFEALVEFVEVEKAWMECILHDDQYKQISWVHKNKLTTMFFEFRDVKKGLAYLDWEMSSPETPDHQKEKAKEILDLYTWYKHVYPNRLDPYEESGYNAAVNAIPEEDNRMFSRLNHIPSEVFQKIREMEDDYMKEEDEMLVRLIKVRRGLWT